VRWRGRKTYLMSVKLATSKPADLSNREYEAPMSVQVTSRYHKDNTDVRSTAVYTIPVPYTEALFQMTEPIEIELGGGVEDFVLSLPALTDLALAVKEIRLSPADGEYGFSVLPEEIPSEIPFFPPANDRGEITTDPITGVITVPPFKGSIKGFNEMGISGGWAIYDSIYGGVNLQAYFPDKVKHYYRYATDFIKDHSSTTGTSAYGFSMVYRTYSSEGADEGSDKPISAVVGASRFDIPIINTNGAVMETEPVTVDFGEGGSGFYWVLFRDEGCKWPIMLLGFKLTPISSASASTEDSSTLPSTNN